MKDVLFIYGSNRFIFALSMSLVQGPAPHSDNSS